MSTAKINASGEMRIVTDWYDSRANIAALIRHFGDDDITVHLAADIVAKPWCWDAEWDAYQATLPESQRWRGTR